MRHLINFVSLLLISLPVFAQDNNIITPRGGLTGTHITELQLQDDIGILITPNSKVFQSDEINTTTKTIPVYVWRTRNGDFPCVLKVFQVKIVNTPQIFTLRNDKLKEFDGVMFEGRSWYSLTTNLNDPIGTGLLPDLIETGNPQSGYIIYCRD